MSQLPAKKVRYGNQDVSLVRQGLNVYACYDGVCVFDRDDFKTMTEAKAFFDQTDRVPLLDQHRQQQQESTLQSFARSHSFA